MWCMGQDKKRKEGWGKREEERGIDTSWNSRVKQREWSTASHSPPIFVCPVVEACFTEPYPLVCCDSHSHETTWLISRALLYVPLQITILLLLINTVINGSRAPPLVSVLLHCHASDSVPFIKPAIFMNWYPSWYQPPSAASTLIYTMLSFFALFTIVIKSGLSLPWSFIHLATKTTQNMGILHKSEINTWNKFNCKFVMWPDINLTSTYIEKWVAFHLLNLKIHNIFFHRYNLHLYNTGKVSLQIQLSQRPQIVGTESSVGGSRTETYRNFLQMVFRRCITVLWKWHITKMPSLHLCTLVQKLENRCSQTRQRTSFIVTAMSWLLYSGVSASYAINNITKTHVAFLSSCWCALQCLNSLLEK